LIETEGSFDAIISDFRYPGHDPQTMRGGIDLYLLTKPLGVLFYFFSAVRSDLIRDVIKANGYEIPKERVRDKVQDPIHGIVDDIKNILAPAPEDARQGVAERVTSRSREETTPQS
jgi:hypothetical protein